MSLTERRAKFVYNAAPAWAPEAGEMSKPQRRNATLVRMLDLLRLLHRSGAMTIRELAAETGVTSRTIYRDLNAKETIEGLCCYR